MENKQLSRKVSALDDEIKDLKYASESKEDRHKLVLAEHAELRRRFQELQRGFLLGHLQDEVKEMLLDTLPGGAGDSDPTLDKLEAIIEEQSAMQKLVQQVTSTTINLKLTFNPQEAYHKP